METKIFAKFTYIMQTPHVPSKYMNKRINAVSSITKHSKAKPPTSKPQTPKFIGFFFMKFKFNDRPVQMFSEPHYDDKLQYV